MKRTSLRALREMVDATTGKPLPTVKALRESGGDIIASVPVGSDGLLTVYKSGFYIYKTGIGSTVYAVDRCVDYAYEDGGTLNLDDEDWPLRLALEGEDRLEKNNDAREQRHNYSYSGDTVERRDLRDSRDFVLELEAEELLDEMLACLTERQGQVVRMYFLEGLTQTEIAAKLLIGQRAVSYALDASMKKIKKLFPRYF